VQSQWITLAAFDPEVDRRERTAALAAARSQAGVVAVVLAAAGLAWWSTAERMVGMSAAPGADPGTLGWFTATWAAMMAAMMLPSLAPTAASVATLARRRETSPWPLFAAGYLLAWTAAGVVAYAVFVGGRQLLAHDLAWRSSGHLVAAGVLVIAAVYELTPLKNNCLTRCRQPLRLLQNSWRKGPVGALSMGVRNGWWCLGCSWALMAALFALGVMSLTWMVLIAGLVMVEKLAPWERAARILTAAVLIALGVGLVVAPTGLPGLVVPGSSGAPAAMSGMG
jgi:predicted metal-binding membrane protein